MDSPSTVEINKQNGVWAADRVPERNRWIAATSEVIGPPGMRPAYYLKPAYNFTIDGVERKATDACAEYLTLLERMLAEFKADHP